MAKGSPITTREFLRNFRKYKEMLRTGVVHYVRIRLDDGEELALTLGKKRSTGEEIAKTFRKGRPIHIERPLHLFDDLLRRRR